MNRDPTGSSDHTPTSVAAGKTPTTDVGGRYSLFIRATIYRPIGLLVLFVAFLVVGVIAYPRIPLQLMPSGLSMGSCSVYIPVRDSTPREVMEKIAKPAEDRLRTIPGIRRIVTSASGSRCRIHLELDPSEDVQVVVSEVRDRLERSRTSWPEDVDRYFIWRHRDSDMPVYIAAISMDADEDKVDIDYVFENVIQRRIEAVDGVARVNTWGLLDKRVEIGLKPDQVDAHAVPLHTLVDRLQNDNQTLSVGTIHDGDSELYVVVDGKFRDFDEVLEYPADERFKIKDFASVDYAYAVRDRVSRVNGNISRVIVVNKESAANAVDVCSRIDAAFEDLKKELTRTVPTVTTVESLSWLNQGEMISYSITSLQTSALYGAFFAVVVLFIFFRRLGMTVLVTAAIPFSLLLAVIWLFFREGTFNLVSLMGFSLGIGMLVDNSIVIVENVLRHREKGVPPREAAIAGVTEVGLAVTLATLTTMMVFFPILFLDDPRFKVVAREIGEPVCISVLASLLVALVFIPQGTIYFQRRRKIVPAPAKPSIANRYCVKGVGWCLRHRLETLLLTVVLFSIVSGLFNQLPKKALDSEGMGRLEVHLRLPKNFTLREANSCFAEVERAILEKKEEWQIKSVTSWFRSAGGELSIFLEKGVRVEEDEFFDRLRPILPKLPGVNYRLGFEDFGRESGGERIRVYVRGNDLDHLVRLGESVRSDMENSDLFPELTEVSEWREDEREEVRVSVDRSLAQARGLDTRSVSRAISWALRGAVLPDFHMRDREQSFWIAYEGGPKENVEEIDTIRVWGGGTNVSTVGQIAERVFTPSLGEIHRIDGRMTLAYSAAIDASKDPTLRHRVRQRLDAHFAGKEIPEGFEVSTRRQQGGFEDDMTNAVLALLLGFALVFFLMGFLFESFLMPLCVLFSVPFAFSGSVILLWLTGVALDLIGMIGMVMLVGIVVNNAIVLVDYIRRVGDTGIERASAIEQAVQVRFRPIWMTALTTVFGLLPLLLLPQQGQGIDYKPLAVVLVGGLLTATFFTLFLVPVLYSLLDSLRVRTHELWSGEARLLGKLGRFQGRLGEAASKRTP